MKYLITALLFLSIISCQDQEFENLEVLTQNINPEDSHRIPECLELEIESTEDIVPDVLDGVVSLLKLK